MLFTRRWFHTPTGWRFRLTTPAPTSDSNHKPKVVTCSDQPAKSWGRWDSLLTCWSDTQSLEKHFIYVDTYYKGYYRRYKVKSSRWEKCMEQGMWEGCGAPMPALEKASLGIFMWSGIHCGQCSKHYSFGSFEGLHYEGVFDFIIGNRRSTQASTLFPSPQMGG